MTELRLYVVAILAAVYTVSWRAITGSGALHGPNETPAAADEPAVPTDPAAPTAVWLDDLPAAERPPMVLPAGWRVVPRGTTPTLATPPRVVRVPAPRPLRVRTRSS